MCSGSSYAQETGVAERKLNDALVQYKGKIEDLSRSRGVSSSSITGLSVDDNESLELSGARPIRVSKNITREDLSEALKSYPDSTAVLFYSYRGESLSIWLIDKDGLKASHVSETPRFGLNAAMTNLRSSLRVDALQFDRAPHLRGSRRTGRRKGIRLSMQRSIVDLTNILLPPAITQELTSVRHLIIAPVMGIGTVPFAMLRPFGRQTCLIDKMSVSVVPSVYDVLIKIDDWNPNFSKPLVVGNPYFPPSKTWEVPQLPGAQEEALYVGKAVNTKALVGKKATKDEVIAEASDADFLYFATHGIASNDNPLTGGFLLFSARELEQGWWTAREIQQSKFKARVAVLSACQTGLGRVHDAGIIGLSRAFQIAGVPRVAMSLWSVDDKATSELMRAFVDNLRDNVPAEALRLAMLDLKTRQPNPSKWASFVLFGTPR